MSPSSSRRRYRTRGARRQLGANAVPQCFVDYITEHVAGQPAVAEWRARDVAAANAGEMHEDIAGVGVAEHPPRIAFVGYTVIGVEAKPVLVQDPRGAMELREFLIGPTALTRAGLRRGFRASLTAIPHRALASVNKCIREFKQASRTFHPAGMRQKIAGP